MNKTTKIALWVCGVPVALFFGSAVFAGISESMSRNSVNKIEVVSTGSKLGKGQAYERYALSNAIMGKNSNEVKYLLGNPNQTQNNGLTDYWYYSNVTWDYGANRLDSSVQIVLEMDKVKSVNFN